MPINQNQALFALLGTQYGGNGTVNFALPDLRGRAAVHRSANEFQGQALGVERVVLNSAQLPPHTHALRGTPDAANQQMADGGLLAARSTRSTSMLGSVNEASPVAMNGASISGGGSNQAHDNMAPFTVLNFVIALQGIFPSRNESRGGRTMSTPYVGEIRLFAGNFAPQGWALCQGQLLAIAQNDVLFALLGTTHGGDGVSNFALPDLRGRVPVHQGTGPGLSTRTIGEQGGVEQVTLTSITMPAHGHTLVASSTRGKALPGPGAVIAATTLSVYGGGAPSVQMSGHAIAPTGGGAPHENMPPFAVVNPIISLFGICPPPA